MKKIYLVLFLLIFLKSGLLTAQESITSHFNKINQHSISAGAIAALAYSYAHIVRPNLTFGSRIQIGVGFRYLITNPSINYRYDQDMNQQPTRSKVKSLSGGMFFDLAMLELFYRSTLLKHFFYESGPYFTVGFTGDSNFGFNTGIVSSIYYQFGKLYFGTRLLTGIQSIERAKYFGIDIVPISFGIHL